MTEAKSQKETLIFVCIVMFLDALGFGAFIGGALGDIRARLPSLPQVY